LASALGSDAPTVAPFWFSLMLLRLLVSLRV
jgi:hypothetical protein